MNAWSDLLPLPTLVELLDQHFFPKWLKTLTMWINMNPNHEQISNWYTGWKSLMPAVIVEHPTIKGRFHSALDIMSRAVGGPTMPQPPPPPTIHVTIPFYNGNKYFNITFFGNYIVNNHLCLFACYYFFVFLGWPC